MLFDRICLVFFAGMLLCSQLAVLGFITAEYGDFTKSNFDNATAFYYQNKYAKAEKACRLSLAELSSVDTQETRETRTELLLNILTCEGKFAEIAELLEKKMGNTLPIEQRLVDRLGQSYIALGKADAAKNLQQRNLDYWLNKANRSTGQDRAYALSSLGREYQLHRNFLDAKKSYEAALTIYTQRVSPASANDLQYIFRELSLVEKGLGNLQQSRHWQDKHDSINTVCQNLFGNQWMGAYYDEDKVDELVAWVYDTHVPSIAGGGTIFYPDTDQFGRLKRIALSGGGKSETLYKDGHKVIFNTKTLEKIVLRPATPSSPASFSKVSPDGSSITVVGEHGSIGIGTSRI